MPNPDHVEIFHRGWSHWNRWRQDNPLIHPDLSYIDLTTVDPPYEIDDSGNRHEALFWQIDLRRSSLRGAKLSRREFHFADLSECDLEDAVLNDALLKGCKMTGANLRKANLKGARLIFSDLTRADLTGALVFGISPWDVELEGATQHDLVLTPPMAPTITVDSIEVAQFVYSLLQNRSISNIVDSLTRRVVLLLGRFEPEQKEVLDAVREALRHTNHVPLLFDFEKPNSRNTQETVTLLARIARFIIADLTEARSVLQELAVIVPDLPSVPVQPILLEGEPWPGMMDSFERFPWFLERFEYRDPAHLLSSLPSLIEAAVQASRAQERGR
jgi:uncharacterized protein YjbI with pentapeptide repeats